MDWWQVLLYIIALLLLVYIVFLFYALESILTFKGKIKKRTTAISVLLSEKKDVLLSIYAIIEKLDLDKDDAIREGASKVRWLKIIKLKSEEIQECILTLSALQKRLFLLGEGDTMKNNEEYSTYLHIISDLDANYRRLAAIYNSDVVGYEYWRKTPLFSWIFFLIGFKKIDRLS